jgi:N-acetyl-alpha-D-muramate 1-phosphate uridylyltransferase
MVVAILAGGLGTRLGRKGPKALVPVAGKPFLFRQLALLKRRGIKDVVLCVGRGGELLRAAAGDGKRLGLRVRYSDDGPKLLGTAGALAKARKLIGKKPFLVLYGDSYLDVDYRAVARAFRGRGALMTVFKNRGRWGQSNAELLASGLLRYDKRRPKASWEYLDYGLSAIGPDVRLPKKGDLAGVFEALSRQGRLKGFEVFKRFYEVGSPAGLAAFRRKYSSQA